MPDVVLEPAQASDIPTVRALLEEYCAWIELDLAFQEIDAELAGLPGAYAPPDGLILLARMHGATVGMVAYRRLDAQICEMKRLFIQASARGRGLSRILVTALMEQARAAGYREMYLDTLPKMDRAQQLYESLGFRDIPPYYETPIAGTRFMACRLAIS
jgi:ribosomal protein S18 acetylase RimI-like enzyme